MGYTTEFKGKLTITPALTMEQYAALNELHDADDDGTRKEICRELANGVSGAPSGYCQWIPAKNGKGLEWDGGEKFYDYIEWMQFLCKVFAAWGVEANGEIAWKGEERSDVGTITVTGNNISAEKEDIVPKGKDKIDVAIKTLEKIVAMGSDGDADDFVAIASAAIKVLKKK